jgi:predicted GNAT family N-acyltransferase
MTIEVRVADFDADYASLRAVRFTVFVDEQQVPAEIEMDGDDCACIHVLAMDNDEPVGTGRIDIEKSGKIGRVAVLASRRRQGIGDAIMAFIHGVAEDNALTSVWCNAQVSAVPFYSRLGYRITSTEPFNEAGIPHVRMELPL